MFPKNFLWGGAVAANQCEGAYNEDGEEFFSFTDDLGDFTFFHSSWPGQGKYPNNIKFYPKTNTSDCEAFDYKNPDKGSFVCSDDYRILLIKNGKIVYNRLCYSSTKKIHINMESFILVKGDGYFDGKVVDDQGYFAPNPIFMVVKDKQSMEYDIYALGF